MTKSKPLFPEASRPPGPSKSETALDADANSHEVTVELIDKPTMPTDASLSVTFETPAGWSERVSLDEVSETTVEIPPGDFLRAAATAEGITEDQRIRYKATLTETD